MKRYTEPTIELFETDALSFEPADVEYGGEDSGGATRFDWRSLFSRWF